MIILYACLLLALMHAMLPGSDLRRLGHIRLRHTWLVWLALVDQIVVISVLPNMGAVSEGAHLASYGLAALFAVLNNRSAGTWIVGIGGICNLAAIVANGGIMPATSGALKASGWRAAPGHFANSAALPHPRLVPLGDVFSTPPWFPVHSVFSVGDVVIVLGVALFLHSVCRSTDQGEPPGDRSYDAAIAPLVPGGRRRRKPRERLPRPQMP
jgi:hypothetical protein